jgi:hypothetical protein
MRTVGLELNDVGVLAAVHDRNEVSLIDLNETSERSGWPAFALKRSDGLAFGQPAEDQCMATPRQVCSTFLEELSHGSSHLGGNRNAPAYSELTYYFLRDVLDRVRERVGQIDRVLLTVPQAYLEEEYGRSEKIGLLLGMIKDIGVPLVGIAGIAVASLYRSLNPLPPPGVPFLHIELFLHSIQISVCIREAEIRSQRCYRFQQLGFVQMMRVLSDAMGDRLLRETAFDVSEDRRIEQSFYRKVMEVLASEDRSRETVLDIQGRNRSRQFKITREVLRTDVGPYVESILIVIDRLVREVESWSDRSIIVLSDRANRIRGFEAGLRARGFQTIVKQAFGAAAFGAAWLARERDVPEDLSVVPVDESLTMIEGEGGGFEGVLRPIIDRLEQDDEADAKVPSHVVINGLAHPIDKDIFTIGSGRRGKEFDLELPRRFSYSGLASCRLVREASGVYLQSDDYAENSGIREMVQSGDRVHFSNGQLGTDLLFIHLGVT